MVKGKKCSHCDEDSKEYSLNDALYHTAVSTTVLELHITPLGYLISKLEVYTFWPSLSSFTISHVKFFIGLAPL